MVNPFGRGKRQVGDNTTKRVAQSVLVARSPTTADTHDPRTGKPYVKGSFWTVDQSPSTGTEGDLWYLRENTATVATWVKLAPGSGGGAGPLLTVRDQVNATAVPDASGNFDFDGAVVANAANPSGIPLETVVGTNLITHQIQVAAAITGSPADKNDAGICSFDDTAFSVDANGYVTLAGGGGPAIDSIDVDTNTGPGTDPVVPNGSGQIAVTGDTVANATNSKPLATHSRAANAYTIEVQVGTAITGAPGDKNDAGLVSFDDVIFQVDADGYTELNGGAAGDFPVFDGTNWAMSSSSTSAAQLPDGTTAQRPGSPADGMIRYNQDEECVEAYVNGAWVCLGAAESNETASLEIFDDMLYNLPSSPGGTEIIGELGWRIAGVVTDSQKDGVLEAGHPGMVGISRASVGSSYIFTAQQISATDYAPLLIGGGAITCKFLVKIPVASTGTERFKITIGLCGFTNFTAASDPDNGCFFTLVDDENSAQWICHTSSGGTATSTNTFTADDNGWHEYEIRVNAAGTSVTFYIDGSLVATNATNIPTSNNIGPAFKMRKEVHAATTVSAYLDYCYLKYDLTTARGP